MADLRDGRGYRQVSRTVRGTRTKADGELARLRLIHSGDAPCPTLGQLWRGLYRPELVSRMEKGDFAPRSLEQYDSKWKRHIAPLWENAPVTGIRGADVQEAISGMTQQTAAKVLTICKKCVGIGIRYDMVASGNVFDRDYLMPSLVNRRDASTYSLRQIDLVERALRGKRAWAAFILIACGGCRPGEAKAVRAGGCTGATDPDTGMRMCLVDISDEVDADGRPAGRLKNGQSYRTAIVPEPWSVPLLDHAERQLERGLAYMSDRGDGRALSTQIMRAESERAASEANVPYIAARNLRPTWRTWTETDARIDTKMLEKLMGHAGDKDTTGRHYYRPLLQSVIREIAYRMSDGRFRSTYGFLWDEITVSAGR